MNRDGLTLLEVVIVTIVVGVLAALGLPKLFKSVELARVTEAYNAMMAIRSETEKCGLAKGNSYLDCQILMTPSLSDLTMENPGNAPGSHFAYWSLTFETGYAIIAERNTLDNAGDFAGETINIAIDYATDVFISCATGGYVSKRWPTCTAPIEDLL